jgi:hypothetical protein
MPEFGDLAPGSGEIWRVSVEYCASLVTGVLREAGQSVAVDETFFIFLQSTG